MCDNWDGDKDHEGKECPSGWWQCDYQRGAQQRTTTTTTIAGVMRATVLISFENVTALRVHEPIPYVEGLGSSVGLVVLAILVVMSPWITDYVTRKCKELADRRPKTEHFDMSAARYLEAEDKGDSFFDRVSEFLKHRLCGCCRKCPKIKVPFINTATVEHKDIEEPAETAAPEHRASESQLRNNMLDEEDVFRSEEEPSQPKFFEERIGTRESRTSSKSQGSQRAERERRIAETSDVQSLDRAGGDESLTAAKAAVSAAASAGGFISNEQFQLFVKDAPRAEPIIEPLNRPFALSHEEFFASSSNSRPASHAGSRMGSRQASKESVGSAPPISRQGSKTSVTSRPESRRGSLEGTMGSAGRQGSKASSVASARPPIGSRQGSKESIGSRQGSKERR
jgi:hypothetical protein